MIHVICNIPETRSVLSSPKIYFVANILTILVRLQVLLPGQLLKVLLQPLRGTAAGEHPGISKMMQEIRQKYYFPSSATYVRNWVSDCEICIQDKRT